MQARSSPPIPGAGAMKHSSRPTLEEIAQVKVEGHQQPGWLRSRFIGWPWPRKGISACGRPDCPVCDAAKLEQGFAHKAPLRESFLCKI